MLIVACIAVAWASALVTTNLSEQPLAWPMVIALWVLAAVAIIGARLRQASRHRLAALALCLTVAALVATTALAQAPVRQPEALREAAEAGRAVTLSGIVVTTPRAQRVSFGFDETPRVLFGVRVDRAFPVGGSDAAQVSVPIQAFAQLSAGASAPDIGARVLLTGKLLAGEPGEPNAFRMYARDAVEVVEHPPWYLEWAAELRSDFRAAAALLPGDGGALLPGLAIGDTTAVSESLDAAMKESNLSHLTAVSGANCAIVVAAIMLLGAAIRMSRWGRISFALTVLLGFIILVTPEPSVLRAGAMVFIVLIGMGSGRPGGGVPALGLAALILLALDPWLAASYGFALSVLATAGLLLLTAPLGAILERWMPRTLALTLAIPLAAQLACQPVLVMLSPAVSFLGVPANLLAGPAAPVATVLGLIACLLVPVLPSFGFAVAQIAWVPAAWIAAVARTISELPGAQAPWLEGVIGAVLLATATAAALWLAMRRPGERGISADGQRAASMIRAPGVAIVSFALIVGGGAYGGILLGGGVVRSFARPHEWIVAQCDVGQGDAVFLRDGEHVALIDTGPDPKPLRACLSALGIARIDLLVLTHFDLDHVGGLAAVSGIVGTALVGLPGDQRDELTLQPLRDAGTQVHLAQRGDHGTLGELNWRVLWPASRDGPLSTGNPGSVVLETVSGGIRSLYLGDLGEESERALRGLEELVPYDIVKVAHHGSSDQDTALYASIRATLGLIGVGSDNGYGHPTQALLDILDDSGTRALRSDLHGLVLISVADARAGTLRVWTERGAG